MGQAGGSEGTQLEERYFRQKVLLGQGSFATVWRAVDRQSGEAVAIKQLDKASMPQRGVTPEDVKKETALMRMCRHNNIAQIFETFEDSVSIFLAMEYCDGGDFGDKLREQGFDITEPEAARWVKQMCDAVCVLHTKGICHRDIKPDNFMVDRRTILKLSDFGLATAIPIGQLLKAPCGTPAFNAPEQHRGCKFSGCGYGLPVDIWALGVSMYMVMFGGKHPFLDDQKKLDESQLLAGRLDFRDRSCASCSIILEGVPSTGLRFSADARQFCRRMVEPDPARRLSAMEVVTARWLGLGGPPRPTPTSSPCSSRDCDDSGSASPLVTPAIVTVPTPARARRFCV